MHHIRFVLAIFLVFLALMATLRFVTHTRASPDAIITVDSTADTNARDGAITLREALLLATGGLTVGDLDASEAENIAGTPGAAASDTIVFDTAVFPTGAPATIALGSSLPTLSEGTDTIDGSAAGVIVDGNSGTFHCFDITSHSNTVVGLEIRACYNAFYIHDGAQGNTIGGSAAGQGNTIAYSIAAGVLVDGTTTTGNTIRGNSIHSNGGKGIMNVNGGNTGLNPPTITGAGSGSGTSTCLGCTLDVFSDDHSEGRIFHGSTTTDPSTGDWSFDGSVRGPYVTATVTDTHGNTSEFSYPFRADSDFDGFTDSIELYLETAPLDDCPDHSSDDAWPLDINIDKFVTVAGDAIYFRGRIGACGGPPPAPNWLQRLDLNADNCITVAGDAIKYRGMIGVRCLNPEDRIARGKSFLSVSQNPNGTWGDLDTTAFRDTTVVLDVLLALGETEASLQRSVAWLVSANAANHDDLARQIVTETSAGDDATALIDQLLSGQHAENFDAASLNFPEGGWGVAPGYSTEVLSTALALRALKAAEVPSGLAVVRAVVEAGSPNAHPFEFPADGSNLTILVRGLTGQIRLFIQTPTHGTFFIDLAEGSTPVNLGGLPEEPGTYILTIQSLAAAPNTYSLEARFLAGSVDVSRITRAVSYLGLSQEADCGWAVSRGQASHLMVTAEVLLTLAQYGDSVAPTKILDCGVDWLEARQDFDGGFGSEGEASTAYETALAMLAVESIDPASGVLPAAARFLSSTQNANGSWNQRPYETALAISALAISPPAAVSGPMPTETLSATSMQMAQVIPIQAPADAGTTTRTSTPAEIPGLGSHTLADGRVRVERVEGSGPVLSSAVPMEKIAETMVARQPSNTQSQTLGKSLSHGLATVKSVLARISSKVEKGEPCQDDLDQLRAAWPRIVIGHSDLVRELERTRAQLAAGGQQEKSSRVDDFLTYLAGEMEALKGNLKGIFEAGSDGPRLRQQLSPALEQLGAGGAQHATARQATQKGPSRPAAWGSTATQAEPVALGAGSSAVTGSATLATAPPSADDLEPLPECLDVSGQIPQEIVDLATSLDHSPVRIYEFVRNEFGLELYFGSLKGCVATLQTRAGNDYDLASLLIALLRASGIPARFTRGTVDIEPQHVNDWLGITDPAVANSLLNTAGIEAIPYVDPGTGEIVFYRIDRVWVSAYVPYGNYRGAANDTTAAAWVPLDPAFKMHEFQLGIADIPSEVPFDRAGYLSTVRDELPFEFYQEQVRQFLQTNMPGSTLSDVAYAGTIIPDEFGLLPASLPFDVVSVDDEFSEIPDGLRHEVGVTLNDAFGTLLESSLTLPEVSLERKTISYVAATQADQDIIDSFGGLQATPCYMVDLRPQLKLDGVVLVEGTPVAFCDDVALTLDFVLPEAGVVDSVTHDLIAGQYLAVALDGNQISQRLLDDRVQRLLDANSKVGTPDENQDDLTGELLNIAGLLHFLRVREGEQALLDLFQYQTVRQVSEGIMVSNWEVDYLFDRPFAVTPGNLVMDVARQVSGQFGIDGDNSEGPELRGLKGLNGSAQEHQTWEELAGIESVSTVKALQLAYEAGEPVHEAVASDGFITCKDGVVRLFSECLAEAGVSGSTINAIKAELGNGWLITVPEAVICPTCSLVLNDWSGTGYISEEPGTGAAKYIISGGIASQTQAGGATTATRLANVAIIPVDAEQGAGALSELPTHTIEEANIEEMLASLQIPPQLKRHVRALVGEGRTVTLSDVVLDVGDREVLVYRVDQPATGEAQFFFFDMVAGGAGTEADPYPEAPPPGTEGDPLDPCARKGNSVNVGNGNMFEHFEDIRLRSPGLPGGLTRTCNIRSSLDGPFGFGWTHDYDTFLIENPDESVTFFEASGAEYLFTKNPDETYSSPPGLFLTLTKNATKFALRQKDGLTFEFGLVDGRLLAVRDRNGNEQILEYDPDGTLCSTSGVPGNLCTVTDNLGQTLRFSYDADDHITSLSDFIGRTWTYTYDGDGNLGSVTTPSDVDTPAATTTYTYYTADYLAHNLNTITDPLGNVSSFVYYANDKTFQERGPDITEADGTVTPGATTTFYYHPDRSQTRVIDARGGEQIYTFDDSGFVTEIQQPDGTVIRTTWDADGNRTSVTDQLGRTATFNYDDSGNLLESVNPLGNSTSFTYEPTFNQVATITDFNRQPLGAPETDAQCGLSGTGDGIDDDSDAMPDDGCPSTIIGYDPNGNPTTITDAVGTVTEMAYDEPVRNPSPAKGLLTRVTNALGLGPELENTTLFEYDADGRLIKTTDPLGNETVLAYDARGNVISSTDAQGRTTTFDHDLLDRLITVIDAATPPGVTEYTYDLNGTLIQVTDANGHVTQFEYDEANRLQRTIDPLSEAETFRYDGSGNLIATTDRNGETLRFEYDALDRLVRKVLPGNLVTTYGYDVVGNLISVVDPDGVLTMTYDDVNRLESASTASSPFQPDVTLNYTYDANGNRLTMTDPTGTTTYVYDELNRLMSFTNPSGQSITFDYDELSRRTELVLPNGVVTSYDYDDASQLLSLGHDMDATIISSFSYTYDGIGNRTSLTQQRTAIAVNPLLAYDYDELNRLEEATRPLPGDPAETFTYDAVGNRMLRDGQTTPSVFDEANRLLEDEGFTYGYDANGNLVQKTDKTTGETTIYTYDGENQLTRINLPDGSVAQYRYDGLGRRIEKCVEGDCVRYVYDNEDILLEYDVSNTLLARYTHGPSIDEPLIMERDLDSSETFEADERFFYHADGLGSVTELNDSAGEIAQAYVYDSFGNIVAVACGATTFTGIDAARAALGDPVTCLANPYTYTSREFDPKSGLHYYRLRIYDPETGRFLREDPIASVSGLSAYLVTHVEANLYTYVANNPVGLTDPFGLEPWWRKIGQFVYTFFSTAASHVIPAPAGPAVGVMLDPNFPEAVGGIPHIVWESRLKRALYEEGTISIEEYLELHNLHATNQWAEFKRRWQEVRCPTSAGR